MVKMPLTEIFEIFGKIFFLANRLEYLGDKYLEDDELTTKQWQLIAVTEKYFTYPPSLSEVAEVLSTTHQNIKQIALKLQEKGFISIEKDENDKRILRLNLTEKNKKYWESRRNEEMAFLIPLFNEMTEQEIINLFYLLTKMQKNIDLKYNEVKANKSNK